jgi:5'-3' exonuclease
MHLVFDGNNLAWAGYHALRRTMDVDTPERKARATLLGLTQSVLGLVARGGIPPADMPGAAGLTPLEITGMTIAFDEGRPLRRRSMFPAYQTGRESDPSFMENEVHILDGVRQFIEAATAAFPVTVLRGVNTEADDLIAAHVLSLDVPARISSSDRDFLQLVDDRVSIYSPIKRVVVGPANFAAETAPKTSDGTPVAFPLDRYLDYRAASGDASDDLPGIPGVGTISAAKMVARAPLDEYLDAWNQLGLREALGRKVKAIEEAFTSGAARAAVDRNRSLMDLRLAAKNYPDMTEYTTTGKWDAGAAKSWLSELRPGNLDVNAVLNGLERVAAAG